jgi:hypothetical protein
MMFVVTCGDVERHVWFCVSAVRLHISVALLDAPWEVKAVIKWDLPNELVSIVLGRDGCTACLCGTKLFGGHN